MEIRAYLILDEPTSMIDPLGKQFIFDILRSLKEAGRRTLIVVEHNIEQLAPLADQLLLMHEGQITRLGQALSSEGIPNDILTVDEMKHVFAERLSV